MFTQNLFLTATPVTAETIQEPTATPEVTATVDTPATVDVTGATDVSTEMSAKDLAEQAAIETALAEYYSTLTPEAQEKIGENWENMTLAEDGSFVVIDPVTGETTPVADLGVDANEIYSILGFNFDTPVVYNEPAEMTGGITGLYVVYGFVCVVLIAFILSQSKRSASFGNGMSGGGQSYWDKNKKHSKEGQMDFFTKVGIAVFMVLTFVITLV